MTQTWPDKGFKVTVVTQALPSLHGGSLDITLTVPLNNRTRLGHWRFLCKLQNVLYLWYQSQIFKQIKPVSKMTKIQELLRSVDHRNEHNWIDLKF